MTDRAKRMEVWKERKRSYRNAGGKNWKAAKKKLKRAARIVRAHKNRLIDNVRLSV